MQYVKQLTSSRWTAQAREARRGHAVWRGASIASRLLASSVVLAAQLAGCQATLDLDELSFAGEEEEEVALGANQGQGGTAANLPAAPAGIDEQQVDASAEPGVDLPPIEHAPNAGADGGTGCPPGEHDCDGICHPDTSLESCGPSCTVCAAPAANGIATCDGTLCGVRCDTGYHACNGQCVDNDSVNSCGDSCVPCLHPDNGEAICVGGSCGTQCDPQFHDCNGLCVPNTDPQTCGGLCEPCPAPEGGSARCEAGVCVPECPPDQEVCRTTCIPSGTPCDGECPAGTHVCGAFCSPNDSTNSCGEQSCEACESPANGQPSCTGVGCGISCNTSFHPCNGACASDYDVRSCGTSCTSCPAGPANSVPACTSTAAGIGCDFACVTGFHRCGNTCASDSAVATCGSGCQPCAAPTNGFATCNGTSCGIGCDANYKVCCRTCIPADSECSLFTLAACRGPIGPRLPIEPAPTLPRTPLP